MLSDDADSPTAEESDRQLDQGTLDSGKTADFRWCDLRAPLDTGCHCK